MKVGYFVHTHEALIERLGRRAANQYTKFKNKELGDCNRSEERYEAINFTNSKTVELRFFASTLDPEVLKEARDMAVALVKYGKRASTEVALSKSHSQRLFLAMREEGLSRIAEALLDCGIVE